MKRTADVFGNDLTLINAAKKGDQSAFQKIYLDNKRYVEAVCFRILKNPALVEDLTQTVFTKVFTRLDTFKAQANIKTWITRVAVTTCLMENRKRLSNILSLDEMLSSKRGGSTHTQESKLLAKDDKKLLGIADRNDLMRLVMGLPENRRTVFLLRAVEELTEMETADKLGFTLPKVKSLYQRARVTLQNQLGK